MNLGAAASGCFLHLPFGAIGPLGPYDAECTLELQLHPYWMALELIAEEGTGIEKLSQLQFYMSLVALSAQGDHAVLRPIWIGWLTRLLEFCDGFLG